jgi:cell division protease FtsH
MGNDNKNLEPKKGFSGGVILLLLVALLIFLTFQNISSDQAARVSFSYQLEQLVDLDLIQPSENRKIAQNDNLVTFTGKFRDKLSDDAKNRYKYLEILQRHNELLEQEKQLSGDLATMQKSVYEAADWFLHISGIPIPPQGYWVVNPLYDTTNRENGVVIKSLSDRTMVSFTELAKESPPGENTILEFEKNLNSLLQAFMSPALGIGDEGIKQELKQIEQGLIAQGQTTAEKIAYCTLALEQLKGIIGKLGSEANNARLLQLRSVRNYLSDVNQYNQVIEDLDKNGLQFNKARESVASVIWFFNNQELSTRALEKQDSEIFSHWFAQAKKEYDAFPANRGALFKAPDQPRTLVLDRTFKSEEPALNYLSYFITIMPFLALGFLLYFIFSRQMKGVGNSAMSFGKSPARLLTKERNKVTFKDVAGCDEAKEELQEIIDFLRDPGKFTALGARIPKGVLCVGAPGTGKTLIAKAVAGEADRPFFFISGSDFVEMFVGVGASRIRDMFNEARKSAPCIIFMDEIDAVGRHRGAGIGGGHDEREQTLNQLLVEMDGFDPTEGIILIAATNRPDVLDKALLRPGRFDRRVIIDLPDIKGRFEILKVHARRIKLDISVDLMDIARCTAGSSGADLANILNEAALAAARRNRSAVTAQEAREAVDKVKYGKERRSLDIDDSEKKTTAYHESGHAILGLLVKHGDPVDKVTIIPRGLALGATHFMPKKNRLSYWKKELLDRLVVLMGGRAAEEVFVQDISSGAQMDISQATAFARSMVCEWGMSPLGAVAYDERSEGGMYLGVSQTGEKKYSDETAQQIDAQVRMLLDEAYVRAIDMIHSNRDKVEQMTLMLMEFETLDKEDISEIIQGCWDIEKKRSRVKIADERSRKLSGGSGTPSSEGGFKDSSSSAEPQSI